MEAAPRAQDVPPLQGEALPGFTTLVKSANGSPCEDGMASPWCHVNGVVGGGGVGIGGDSGVASFGCGVSDAKGGYPREEVLLYLEVATSRVVKVNQT